jgi:hypothetical protein
VRITDGILLLGGQEAGKLESKEARKLESREARKPGSWKANIR